MSTISLHICDAPGFRVQNGKCVIFLKKASGYISEYIAGGEGGCFQDCGSGINIPRSSVHMWRGGGLSFQDFRSGISIQKLDLGFQDFVSGINIQSYKFNLGGGVEAVFRTSDLEWASNVSSSDWGGGYFQDFSI